ncbi:MAG: RNA 2'-phosphotransferase [Candidatus Thermoplasmatota archaeon]
MLAKCKKHGYYRDETCPICGEKGKFIMNDKEMSALSRIMAGALRHFPDKMGVEMDGRGWVDISSLIEAIGTGRSGFNWLRPYHIEALVYTDPRGRYQIDGGMVRATYGHSIEVNLNDLPKSDLEEFYYPVTEEEADIIVEGGLHPTDRNKVHLSGTVEKALEAGRVRTDNPLILKINGKKARGDGIDIYKAGNDVYITDRIDAKYISKLENPEIK